MSGCRRFPLPRQRSPISSVRSPAARKRLRVPTWIVVIPTTGPRPHLPPSAYRTRDSHAVDSADRAWPHAAPTVTAVTTSDGHWPQPLVDRLAERVTQGVPLLLVGVPGSGKSTLATAVADHTGAVYINLDQLRGQVPGSTGPGDQSVTPAAVAAMRTQLAEALADGAPIIIDNTNTNRRDRQSTAQTCAAAGRPADVLIVDTPTAVCIARDAARQRSVGADVITRIAARLADEPPAADTTTYASLSRLDPDGRIRRVVGSRRRKPGPESPGR